jgi:hypothetical protein
VTLGGMTRSRLNEMSKCCAFVLDGIKNIGGLISNFDVGWILPADDSVGMRMVARLSWMELWIPI